MRLRRRPPVAGFTLIEVLVALAILAIGLVAAIRTGIASSDTASTLRSRQLAIWVAENRLATLRATRQVPPPSEERGEVELGGGQFVWQMTVGTMPQEMFRRVEIRVYEAGSSQPVAQLNSFVGGL